MPKWCFHSGNHPKGFGQGKKTGGDLEQGGQGVWRAGFSRRDGERGLAYSLAKVIVRRGRLPETLRLLVRRGRL